MIKASDLRIGNKVISTTHNLLDATVSGIMPTSGIITLKEVSTYDTANKLNPIPLTPEWLERCGFEFFNKEGIYVRKIHAQGELMLFSTDSPVAQSNNFPPGKFYYIFSGVAHFIEYLHQLQNLYHALTGEELIITL